MSTVRDKYTGAQPVTSVIAERARDIGSAVDVYVLRRLNAADLAINTGNNAATVASRKILGAISDPLLKDDERVFLTARDRLELVKQLRQFIKDMEFFGGGIDAEDLQRSVNSARATAFALARVLHSSEVITDPKQFTAKFDELRTTADSVTASGKEVVWKAPVTPDVPDTSPGSGINRYGDLVSASEFPIISFGEVTKHGDLLSVADGLYTIPIGDSDITEHGDLKSTVRREADPKHEKERELARGEDHPLGCLCQTCWGN